MPPIENNTRAGTPLAIQNAPRQSIALTSPPEPTAVVSATAMIVSPSDDRARPTSRDAARGHSQVCKGQNRGVWTSVGKRCVPQLHANRTPSALVRGHTETGLTHGQGTWVSTLLSLEPGGVPPQVR